jgi:hypothetical protein
MSTYAITLLKYADSEILDDHCAEDELGLGQSYDAFAVLAGIKNYHSIVPLFEPFRELPPELAKVKHLFGYVGAFFQYYYRTWFTLEEFDQLDLDRPLEFLPDKAKNDFDLPDHRRDDVQSGDTYRSFIERKTTIFTWIEKLKQENAKVVILGFD